MMAQMGGLWAKVVACRRTMRIHARRWQGVLLATALAYCACATFKHGAEVQRTGRSPNPSPSSISEGQLAMPIGCTDCWHPAVATSWQIQLTGAIDLSVEAEMYEIDLFDNSASTVQMLHRLSRKVVCYIDAGTWEDWRPDAAQFSTSLLGRSNGWPGERWLDVRQLALLGPILEARLDLCKAKGFDGVEFDNVDGYANNTGFPLTYADQLRFNTYLANEAHKRHLSVGLKNDPKQVVDLVPYFDWAIVEECFQFQECTSYLPFVRAGKPVLAIEYELQPEAFCQQARALQFNAIKKHRNLDAFRISC